MDQKTLEAIQDGIRRRYADVSTSATGKFPYPTGREGALFLAYDRVVIDALPEAVLVSFCGVGNPFALGPIEPGEAVLDVGCGAGFDMIVASRHVGETGRVCGIDLTPEMAAEARRNLRLAGVMNAEVRAGGAEAIPYDDASFDLVLSNGVLNLSPRKEASFQEVLRVLKPGGRLQFADIVLQEGAEQAAACSIDAWSDWIGGAIPVGDLLGLMEKLGFIDTEFVAYTGVKTSESTVGAVFRALKK